jgi:hypothetical protein
MDKKYHIEITKNALINNFNEKTLQTIIRANIGQDSLFYLTGHDHLHFDSNQLDASLKYINLQRHIVIKEIGNNNFIKAHSAFGRLLHAWQDFYSHTNYVKLWLENNPFQSAEEIDPDDENLICHPSLSSGSNNLLIEILALIPIINKALMPLFPPDSHARMNLDSPSSGNYFYFAYWAGIKRTKIEFNHLHQQYFQFSSDQDSFLQFQGKFTH